MRLLETSCYARERLQRPKPHFKWFQVLTHILGSARATRGDESDTTNADGNTTTNISQPKEIAAARRIALPQPEPTSSIQSMAKPEPELCERYWQWTRQLTDKGTFEVKAIKVELVTACNQCESGTTLGATRSEAEPQSSLENSFDSATDPPSSSPIHVDDSDRRQARPAGNIADAAHLGIPRNSAKARPMRQTSPEA
ncbi:unnamed protein product [Zymoseptoria tritici ST99CH_3D1]|nr:unnamed protein product [Zymoseptoria tritici ST99CH_3D1]